MLGFEWDNQKNQLNAFKHGVEFEEAVLAFYDRMWFGDWSTNILIIISIILIL